MITDRIAYRSGYKYQLAEDYSVLTTVLQISRIKTDYIDLDEKGLLTVRHGYAWDGPSGPAFDTPSAMRGSLCHDAFYQLMRMGLLDRVWRETADWMYRRLCIEDGMWQWRAWYHFEGINHLAAGAAKVAARKKIIHAP